ncbi:MAG TPA: hypothetical protein VKX35_04395, partial [Fermentimonas sp.]|nr:hypothetical protein [Fermentimonas sp.]
MKNLLYILFISISLPLFSQWKTVKGEYIHNYRPFNQFTINHYTNEIWLVNPFNATVIKSDGSFVTFGESELGSLWHDDKLNFGFTSSHTFFTKELTGLYLFDNYQKQLLYNDNDFQRVYNDLDTLYLVRFNGHLIKYSYNNLVENTGLNATHCAINKGDIYTNRGSYFYVENNVDNPLWNESFYLQSIATGAMLFKPETDTVFLGQQTGITKCRDGSCFDTITPNNTTNMPSGNILEIEFDANNDLWVAFGDTNDKFIALGKLEGSTWTEVYTAANSPINF